MKEKLTWLKDNWLVSLWIIIGFILLFIYLGIFGKVNWTVLTGFATWILAGGVFFAAGQINEARKSTNAQIAVELFKELRSEKALEIIRFIYTFNPENVTIIYINDYHRIDYILDRFDVLAVLVRKGVIDLELAVDAYAGVTVLRCWYILCGLIYEIRKERKYFGHNIEGFTNECIKYFDKNHIDVGFKNKFVIIDNLVTLLKDLEQEKDEIKHRLYPRTWKKIKKDRKK